MSNIAKISVEKQDTKEQFLYDLDKSKTLCDIIRDICKKAGLPSSPVYGLKLIQTKEDPYVNKYVSDKTYRDVQHSDCLKIVFSIEYLLEKRILPHINESIDSLERAICFEDLLKLSVDPIFIEELVKSGNHVQLIDVYIKNQLRENEQLALLKTICHLLQKNVITDTSQNIVPKTISILKNPADTTAEQIKFALSILHKILVQKERIFLPWKEKIINQVQITELTPFIWSENCKSLHYGILLLINTFIKLCKGEKKSQIIKEMNLRQNRDNIYRHIILPGGLDRNTEHELYVTQTYLLSLYTEALKSEVNIRDNSLFKREEFELCEDNIRRATVLMDFDEMDSFTTKSDSLPVSSKSKSVENISHCNDEERLSLASMFSDESQRSSKISTARSRKTSEAIESDNFGINYLTLEALRHFKKYHYKIFYQSQIEEKIYEPGIFVTSERVVKMLAKMLHIGLDPPDSRSVFYQPIVFNCSSRMPFFLELFSRTMWLLSRTRREMKVSTIEDYPKVMNLLEKQINMVLETRPNDFKCLTDYMTDITFESVLQQWQKEKEEELSILLKTNPCIQELKMVFTKENEINMYNNRMTYLKRGTNFPKVIEKKKSGQMFVQLSKNERELLIYDITDQNKNVKSLQQKVVIADITHIVIGKNCKHSILCSPLQAFSIIVNHSENQVNFIATDERMACYWTDGFNLLTGNNKRSVYYIRELEELVEMDVMLQILELQNLQIPRNPPAVPPPPIELRPPVPPKSAAVIRHSRRRRP